MKAQGKAHKYGDNVDTDVIIPARYLNTADHKELAAHCMEDIDADFINNVKPGDIMVGGLELRLRLLPGARAHRHQGERRSLRHRQDPLPAFSTATPSTSACPFWSARQPATASPPATRSAMDFDTGLITNLTKNETYQAQPLPPFIQNIVNRGGLLNSLK